MNYEPWLHFAVPEKRAGCIDVGANRGTWTRWLATRFEHVHAIEPNPEVLPELRQDLPANVTVYPVAAWDREEPLTFNRYVCPDHLSAFNSGTLLGQIGVVGEILQTITLPAVRLDSLGISGQIDFFKCDTEGAEFQCISGAQNLIREYSPVLLIEIHSAANFSRLNALLPGWNYSVDIVPHPLFPDDPIYRSEHFWIVCRRR
jgi:FkbM family methyltransferase